MVKNAPKFYEVAKQVVEITQNCIFVAHNVRFDYSFIIEEFNRLGFTYSRQQLCTIKLFRKFFPGLKSYSLGNLIKYFKIEVDSRHRAMADVIATLDIMKIGLSQPSSHNILDNSFGIIIKDTKLPPGINSTDINNLPNKIGVYYFLDMFDNIV
jgi:DNA polymerase-3 subunit epsilon